MRYPQSIAPFQHWFRRHTPDCACGYGILQLCNCCVQLVQFCFSHSRRIVFSFLSGLPQEISQAVVIYRPIMAQDLPVFMSRSEQVVQLSQRDRAAGWVSNGQKWKTGTERRYLRTIRSIFNHCDVFGQQRNRNRRKNAK